MTAAKPSPLVPKLRFAEFRDAPGWVQTPLGDAFKTITNGHANAQDHQDDGAYPLFDRSEVVKRSPTFLFDAEAVILPGEGMRFQPRYFNGKFDLHQRAYALMEPTVDPRFAFHALDRFKGALADSAVQSTVLSLRMPIIEKFAIPCPTSDDEQQKIADCLGSLDDMIVADSRKLEALRQHKQGLMQQLFPQPNETVPRLRFPEFEQSPGWEHATVAELVETVTPPKKLTTSTYLEDGRFPVIDQSKNYICGWTNDDEAIITKSLPVIVFGDHTCVLKFVNRPFAQGADGIKILKARRCVSTLYLYHQLTYQPVATEEYKRHFSVLKKKVVYFSDPKTGEQQKIAECLTSIDDQLNAQACKIDTLKQHKQGLLQQLFPPLESQ